MEKLAIHAREITGKKVNALRKQWIIPGVVYGKHLTENKSISFDKNAFLKAYKECGKSVPLELHGDKIDELVLIYNIAVHPVTNMLEHVDFLAVKKGESVETDVTLRFVNQAPAEKNKLGRIEYLLYSVHVSADPTKLPKDIEVDLSTLENIHDVIFVKDLIVNKGVTIETDGAQPVATVVALGDDSEGEWTSESAAGTVEETAETTPAK